MPIGVTSYLKALQPAVPVMTGNRLYRDSKKHGVAVDRLVQKAVKGQATGRMGNSAAHKAKALFFAELHKANVIIDDVQVAVSNRFIRTQLDGLGHTYHNQKVVIELKTSLHPLAFYQKHYQTTFPRGHPTILPHIPNTLYWRHQLQAGFGVACLGGDAKGLVVVVCSDGAMHHWVQTQATLQGNFEYPITQEPPPIRMLPWPGHENIKGLVRGLGKHRKGVKYGVAHYTNAVVGAVSKPGKRERQQRKALREAADKRQKKEKRVIKAFALTNHDGPLRLVPA